MLRFSVRILTILAILSTALVAIARRGNPNYSIYIAQQFHVIDSDDNHPRKPTYNFVDSSFHLITKDTSIRLRFTDTDDGYATNMTNPPDSVRMDFMGVSRRMPPNGTLGSVSVNGIICLDTAAAGPNNSEFPLNFIKGSVAALWADMELRTTGDSSKIFYRLTPDTCYITYYNLALKGTYGKVRTTFQVAFVNSDSSVQINFRSFDGEFCGEPAAKIFQRLATIGCQAPNGQTWTNYLDRGRYHAVSFGSSIYAQDLHDQLAVKFIRVPGNMIRIRAFANPASDRFETNVAQFQPQVKIDNLYSDSLRVKVNNVITNLATGQTIYNRIDSGTIFPYQFTTLSTSQLGIGCGSYRMKTTVTLLGLATWLGTVTATDPWTEDNIQTVDFYKFTPTPEFPNFDDYSTLDRCEYTFKGNLKDSAHLLFYDPPNVAASGALIFDRRDEFNNRYPRPGYGDTLTSAPFNLTGKSNVWLEFSYQRGKRTDSTQAGIMLRTRSGPEPLVTNGSGGVLQGDSLIVEAIPSSAATLNPAAASWATIGKIYGGLDYETRKYRLQLPSAYIHSHTRFRIRLAPTEDITRLCGPADDDDIFVVDELQFNAPEFGRKSETDIEPLGIDLGNGTFTHIPRNVKFLTPKVRIGSNGLQANSAFYVMHLVVKDGLNREVYNRTQTFPAPGPRRDTIVNMPLWQIEGSQGGRFTAKAYVELSPNEYRRLNDTAIFNRTFYIDDMYGLDDNQHDTSGKMTTADGNFTYSFRPMAADSLRGFDLYHAVATGISNWTVTIKGPHASDPILAVRSFNYNAGTAGWWRNTFTPFYMTPDSLYKIQFQLTQGAPPSGDASRGLVWVKSNSSGTKNYDALYPSVIGSFRDASGNLYYSNTNAKNDTGSGPLLPMMRLVFRGSSTYLPVELLGFSAQRMADAHVRLDFRTAQEENLSTFEIERQTTADWTPVAVIAGKNARNGASYKAIDQDAPLDRTTYRLWEIDLDGSRTMLGTAEAGPLSSTGLLAVTCRPNPARDQFTLKLDGASFNGTTSIVIYDELGKALRQFDDIRTATMEVDTRSLAAGTYYVEVTDAGKKARTKIVVTQ